MTKSEAGAADREALKSRVLPQMAFNRVQATLTPKPTQTMPNSQAGDMAKLRFKVEGNAIITGGAGTLGIAAARALLEHGLTGLMIFDRTLGQAESEIEQLRVEYPSAKILSKQVDIIDEVAAAVLAMKNSLAAEWARYGIRVNSISPGYMDTILNEGDGIADARAVWADRNPMGRMGQPNELTGLVVLLASNASSYMNGTDIICDGGQVLL
ncbi:hypothetical protein TrVFT333_009423 [Trichoderma virens FT-333]|nr:hypothetical protein TrVFT333_009423 [Trichoderma virens FT-333]